MTDKESFNIGQIKSFLENKRKYNTGAYTIFNADVTYEARPLQTLRLHQVEVQYQYVDPPTIFIHSLNPPYYEDFRTEYQDFLCIDGRLVISGRGRDGYRYKVIIE